MHAPVDVIPHAKMPLTQAVSVFEFGLVFQEINHVILFRSESDMGAARVRLVDEVGSVWGQMNGCSDMPVRK